MLTQNENDGQGQDVLDWVDTLKAAGQTGQLLIVQAQDTTARVTFCEKEPNGWTEVFAADGYVGAGGIGKSAEGDGKTPVGVYGFTMAFGALDDPGCAIPYTKLDDSHYWVDDPSSQYYNQFVSAEDVEKDWDSAEHLLAVGAAYNYALALDFNSERIPGAGSAIFLHCSTGGPTAGCIAIPEDDMRTFLERVKPGCRVIIDTAEGVRGY